MYQVFDSWLDRDTWAIGGESEDRKFYAILNQVVRRDDFSPNNMGDYFKTKRTGEHWQADIDAHVTQADAVREFVIHNNL